MSLTTFIATHHYFLHHGSRSEFRNWDFLAHIVAYFVSFDSEVRTLKSNIIRPRYELFNAHCYSRLSLPSLSQPITFSIMALALNLKFQIFLPDIVAYL